MTQNRLTVSRKAVFDIWDCYLVLTLFTNIGIGEKIWGWSVFFPKTIEISNASDKVL